MRLRTLSAIPLLFVAAAASADDCDHTAPHRLSADLKGATSVAVIARAGSLRVTGTSAGAVTASGTACASDREYLRRIRIEARREGSELVIEAIIPERTHIFGWHEARLDMEVNVPRAIALRIKDGSGSTEIRDVERDVTIEDDGSGGVQYDRVGGRVRVPRER